jgi:serine/threonine protein kinase
MVTELLGKDLAVYLEKCQGSFSLKTTMMIADQIISILEYVHSRGLVYNDIKPDNFCVGGESNYFHIHMVDYALTRSYKDDNGNYLTDETVEDDISYDQDILFSPLAGHLRKVRYPKDDLESVIYMMIYFMTGTLPWAKILQSDDLDDMSKASQIFTLKRSFSDSRFWKNALIKPSITSTNLELKQLPDILHDLYTKIMNLEIKETPPYAEIRTGFKRILIQNYLQYDFIYD